MNSAFQQIGQDFVRQYYAVFDADKDTREKQLPVFYHDTLSLMSFEGDQVQGSARIMEKIKTLTFNKIQRVLTAVDCQPTFDGGVLINILGQLKMDEDPIHGFYQTFVLKPLNESFFIQHDSFRLMIHNA